MKKLIIFIFILMIMAISVNAVVIKLDPLGILANNSYQTSSTITPNINVTGNSSFWNCKLYTNENGTYGIGSWDEKQTDSSVVNNTATNFSHRQNVAEIYNTLYVWDVFCNSTEDPLGGWGAGSGFGASGNNSNYSVDITNPSITVDYPVGTLSGDGIESLWINNANGNTSIRFGLTIVDNNPSVCNFYLNYNPSTNTTASNTTIVTGISYTNNTQFNFSEVNASVGFQDNNTGYPYSMSCNDSAGRIGTASGIFYVDTILPTAFIFNTSLWKTDNVALWNDTTATDYTPQIGYGDTTEVNFSRYEIDFFKGAYGVFSASTDLQVNITNRLQVTANISTLAGDAAYWILVQAYDAAGNVRNMTVVDYKYSTDSTNRLLRAGWNIIGNVGNAFNLSDLRNWIGATTTSLWNTTHEFSSHVSGGNFGDLSVAAGDTVLIYTSTATTFSDLVWNTSATRRNEELYNLTNQTASAWNLVMQRDHTDNKTFSDIDTHLNCRPIGSGCGASANNASNVTYFSHFDNSVLTNNYVPLVANWSINNATNLEFGDTVWMYIGDTLTDEVHLNWSAIV